MFNNNMLDCDALERGSIVGKYTPLCSQFKEGHLLRSLRVFFALSRGNEPLRESLGTTAPPYT